MSSIVNKVKNVVARVLLAYIGSYVENITWEQISGGILSGKLDLYDLKLKKSALDKLNVPFEIVEGRIGLFSVAINWYNILNSKVDISIEDVQILIKSSLSTKYDREEEEQRAQELKRERLERAETLHDVPEDNSLFMGYLKPMITRTINNSEVSIKNVHVRFEDDQTSPDHPFSAGVTLASFSAISTDENWKPAYLESAEVQSINKLARLDSLAIYFNTDSTSMAGLEYAKSVKLFRDQISSEAHPVDHQYILNPISGEGRIVMNKEWAKSKKPQYDVLLDFKELGFILDNHQYRDIISMVDVYHVYVRRLQYRRFRPDDSEFTANRPRALLKFAMTAIREEVHDRDQKWTWEHFRARGNDRRRYVALFKEKEISGSSEIGEDLRSLELKLTYHDIRFYRSIARSELRKNEESRKAMAENKRKNQQSTSWTSWLLGSTTVQTSDTEDSLDSLVTEQDRKDFLDSLSTDERAELIGTFEKSNDAISAKLKIQLHQGSFRLKNNPHEGPKELMSLVSDFFEVDWLQRMEGFEMGISLGNFRVFDGTTMNTVYNQVVHVKDAEARDVERSNVAMSVKNRPFFSLKYENKPLDGRADHGLTVYLGSTEIIYQRGYVEAIYKFFKPPDSQLQSVGALLDAAGETLEGIQRETRAGLEYALETHETVDVRLDMHAPIIIIPESISETHCSHLVFDAGQVLVESNLADKNALREIESKRSLKYTDEDYRQLESMMYDNFSIRLVATQLVIGDSLEACRAALQSDKSDSTKHLLERANINLLAKNSIVPSARSIPRLKVSGKLPALHINFSDKKYRTLMHLLDVTLPRFDDAQNTAQSSGSLSQSFYQPTSHLFSTDKQEYIVDSDNGNESDGNKVSTHMDTDNIVDTSGSPSEIAYIRQHVFELLFEVDSLQVTVLRSKEDGTERKMGHLGLDQFALQFSMAKFEKKIDIDLRSVKLTSFRENSNSLELVSSEVDSSKNERLMNIAYRLADNASPDYLSVYDGFDQSVHVKLSTFIFRAVPEHVIALYDYIMSTFVPDNRTGNKVSLNIGEDTNDENVVLTETLNADKLTGRICVKVQLASFKVLLLDNDIQIATLSLSTANVDVALHGGVMSMTARLGNLLLIDDSSLQTKAKSFKQLLSIEGSNLAELRYETFAPKEAVSKGIKSSLDLKTGALKFHLLVTPLNNIYLLLLKFARFKALYDAATEAAVQRASEIERMSVHLAIRAPIIVVPIDPVNLEDEFTMKLGEIIAENEYNGPSQKIIASLHGLKLSSTNYDSNNPSTLKIIEDVNVMTDILQTSSIDRLGNIKTPDFKINVDISDVKINLTAMQYGHLIGLSRTIPRVFDIAGEDKDNGPPENESSNANGAIVTARRDGHQNADELETNLLPELDTSTKSPGQHPWLKLDLSVKMRVVKLHLFDTGAVRNMDLVDHGIARFALNDGTMGLKMLSDDSMEFEVAIKSITTSNTKPGPTKFREIMPATNHGRNQVMVLFTMSGGSRPSSLCVVTVDSPTINFSMEPVFAISDFFLSAFSGQSRAAADDSPRRVAEDVGSTSSEQSRLNYRLDLNNASIIVLDDDQDIDSHAIQLSVKQLSVSQQEVLALSISRLGMSLVQMNKRAEAVHFLDDTDITLSLESHSEAQKAFTGINLSVQQVFFRTSYRDITIIASIINKAIVLSSTRPTNTVASQQSPNNIPGSQTKASRQPSPTRKATTLVRQNRESPSVLGAEVITTTEELQARLEGFHLMLINDLQETPMLHLETKPFSLSATNWSSRLSASMTITTAVNYWNLKNSHWEPFIDPWTFALSAESAESGFSAKIHSQELLDINISSTFLELAISTAKIWNREGSRVLQKSRGSYAPYLIVNRTGGPVFIWSDPDGSTNATSISAIRLDQDAKADWRFDDWKKMREHGSSSTRNCIGIRFSDKPWENLRSVPIDKEGQYAYSLQPSSSSGANKLMCEITIKDSVKVVTLRSTYKVENQTFYPLEISLVDNTGHPVYPIEKIAPGQDFTLPIEAVARNRIRIQPDPGFGYKWSQSIWWEDLKEIKRLGLSIRCPHIDRKEAPFHVIIWPIWNFSAKEYPQLSLILRAPIELENLLPYNIQYKIYDKDTKNNWNSYLRKGGNTPVHSVDSSHLVLLSVTVQDTVFSHSDFTIISTDRRSEFEQERQLTLKDAQDRQLTLMLNYIKFPDTGSAFKVQIYSPYIIFNKTGLPLYVKSVRAAGIYKDAAGVTEPEQLAKTSPFMLSHFNKNGNEFIFRLGDTTWSQTIRFDAPSAESALVIPHSSQKSELHVALTWAEGSGKYKLTKVIELAPRFFVINKLPKSINFREHGAGPVGRSELEPGQRSPLLFFRMGEQRRLTIAYSGLDAHWSPVIDMEAIGLVHVRMRPPGSTSREDTHLVDADIVLDNATIFVILSPHNGPWPFVIDNGSSCEIRFGQSDERQDRPEGELLYTLKPNSRSSYAWDFPASKKKKIYLSSNGGSGKVDIMEIGVLPPLKHASGALSLDVRADGQSQLLTITNYTEETSVYKPKRRNANVTPRSDVVSASQDFEAVQEEALSILTMKLEFKGLGVSLMNKKLVEIIYFSIRDLNVEYINTTVAQSVILSVGTLQVDNQLHDAFFPVLLQPTPIRREAQNLGALPTVQASVIVLNDNAHGVLFVKYASILLQAITLQVDEAFLYAVLDLTKLDGVEWEVDSENILIQHPDNVPDPVPVKSGQSVYFELLELQPTILSVSFVKNSTPSDDDTQKMTTRNPLAVLLNVLTMTLANAEGIELQLNALGLTDIRLTVPDLQARILYHYRQEVLRQIYRVLGSADFLGNPVGLFTNVSSGVADIFYEPWHGVVQHGGGELGVGIAKGAASFVKKTIFGVTDSMTKVTASLGKGLSVATLDTEYQERRRMTQRRNKPRHALVGVTAGAEALASSVASGVEGVLMKPIEGAEAEGAVGFFKGVVKGFVGAVTKPVVGVVDLASNVTEGIRNTTTVFDAPQRERVRKPRHIPADGVLKPYSSREALGQYWLWDLQSGKFRKEYYIAHIDLSDTEDVILLTNMRVLSFSSRGLKLQWDLPLTSVAGVKGDHNGIRFKSKAGRDHDRFVIIPNSSSKDWFFEKIRTVVLAFNAKRRLER